MVCIGINPSTANDKGLDLTTYKVEQTALRNDYSGWIMFNLFPQMATNPSDLIKQKDFMNNNNIKNAYGSNIDYIQSTLAKYRKQILHIWCAWGCLINKRNYFWKSFDETYQIINKLDLNDYCRCCGETKKDHHPRHPSRVSNDSPLRHFPIDDYHEEWRDKYK